MQYLAADAPQIIDMAKTAAVAVGGGMIGVMLLSTVILGMCAVGRAAAGCGR